MYKRILIITLAAIGLSFLASSCVKEKGFEDRVKDIVSVKLDSLNKQVTVLEKTQTALNDSLKNVKGNVESLAKQSKDLTDSIATVKVALAAQKEWTEAELDAIGERLDAIEEEQEAFMEEVYTRLGHLWNRIQKIDVIPQYSDGSVWIGKKDTVVNFIVRPDSVAQKLVKAHPKGDSTFTFLAVKTLTKSVANADADTVHLDIKNVSHKDGVVSVRVSGSKLDSLYFEGEQSYSGCLVIGDGNSDNASGFFPLYCVRTDLSKTGTSNCYIVSEAGDYKFKAVKGNSDESVGTVSAVSDLWESYGTSETITTGDLIKSVSYDDGYITFTTGSQFPTKKGNAVIAAKDASNNILWSWHIWLTDQPEEQDYTVDPEHTVYVATMLDRNLGATSATQGEVTALGLLYQWGRKDPFLGSSSISESKQAASTQPWPSAKVASGCLGSDNNTLAYSISHPTTYITNENDPFDWYCTNQDYKNDALWKTSEGKKTIYDPCPVGYRVPNGGKIENSGVWATAFNTDGSITEPTGFANGFDFGATTVTLVSSGICWYPAAGFRSFADGSLSLVGSGGAYWSCAPGSNDAFSLDIFSGNVSPSTHGNRADGRSVRCLKEE